MLFVLIRERGPNWDYSRGLREQDGWDEHAAFMEALACEGFIHLGGPLGDDHVVHVIMAGRPEEIRDRLASDPGSRWACSGTSRSSAGMRCSAGRPVTRLWAWST
jgi:hypothetical protein